MNEIFNLHLDPSGLTGGPMSSRHMNRDQARQVFRDSLINKYTLFRAVDEDSCENFNYIARAEEKLGHKIPFNLSADWNFEEFMGFNGAFYWFREFQRSKMTLMQPGTEAEPTKTDEVLIRSVLLVSINHHANYLILRDEEFSKMSNPQVMTQNALLIDELDKYFNMLNALADGFMWGQGIEQLVEPLFRISPQNAETHFWKEAIAKFGEPSTPLESTILEDGTVSLKDVEDS
jgi:hypothetical protein